MTTPGARAAQQAYQQQAQQNSANFHRNAAYQDHLRYRRQHPRGRKHSAGVRSVVGRDAGSLVVDRIEWLLASGGVG